MKMYLPRVLLSLSVCLSVALAAPAPPTPTVTAPAGTIIGRVAPRNPTVHEYLGIPYAEPPIRFAPAIRRARRKPPITAKDYGLSCPAPPIDISGVPVNLTVPEGDDCLSVNVWTKPGRNNAPVLFWIYGGGFQFGTSNFFLYDGAQFVDANEIIIVTINYRTNVFGFPNSPAVTTENLGILDQRLALEWVRDNIKAFGGNPDQITIFGQSAGGASVEVHSYAWATDPIVKGYIPQSGTAALVPFIGGGNNYFRWGNLTRIVGCGVGTETQKLACMRALPHQKIIDGMNGLEPCNTDYGSFGPRVDGKVIFTPDEYRVRAESGQFAKLPLLIGNTDEEFGGPSPLNATCSAGGFPIPPGLTPEQLAFLAGALSFTCPASDAARVRAKYNVPVWRYRYFGSFNFNTTFPLNLGSSHGSEIPVLFGTALLFGNPPVRERKLLAYIQAMWTTFAKNPSSGLSSAPFNLPVYKPLDLQPTLLRLAYKQEIAPSLAYPLEYDWACLLVALLPKPMQKRVESIRRGDPIERALSGIGEEDRAVFVNWAHQAAKRNLQEHYPGL